MAALIAIMIVVGVAALVFGAYLRICLAISREDRIKGSLRFDAPSHSARSARRVVGLSGSRSK